MIEAAGMGAMQMGINYAGNKNITGMRKKQRDAKQRHDALMYELANKELDQGEKDLAQGDVDNALAINDAFNQRGDGGVDFVSGTPQAHDRRERDYTARKEALMRERARLKSAYMTNEEIQNINKRISKAQNQLAMMNAFLGGGAMGMGSFASSPQGQNLQGGIGAQGGF